MTVPTPPGPGSLLDSLARQIDRSLLRMSGLSVAPRRTVRSSTHLQRLGTLHGISKKLDACNHTTLWPAPTGELRYALSRSYPCATISWPSTHTPQLASASRWFEPSSPNASVAARLCHSEPPRPVAILLHGYLGGHATIERLVWPTRYVMSLGYDVCWLTLPFHGSRAGAPLRPPPFPGRHADLNIEALRQSVLDLGELILWLARRGHPQVGVIGFSLGGYVAALTATINRDLGFAVAIAPCSSVADFARDVGGLGIGTESEELHSALTGCYAAVSPLTRSSLVPPERWLVLAGRGDGVTGMSQARALADHVGAQLWSGSGGHCIQLWRKAGWQSIGAFLTGLRGNYTGN